MLTHCKNIAASRATLPTWSPACSNSACIVLPQAQEDRPHKTESRACARPMRLSVFVGWSSHASTPFDACANRQAGDQLTACPLATSPSVLRAPTPRVPPDEMNTFAGVADVISLALCCAGCKPESIKPALNDVRRAAKRKEPCVCDTLPAFSAWLLLEYRLFPRICFQACIRHCIFLQPSRPFAPRPARCNVCRAAYALPVHERRHALQTRGLPVRWASARLA